MHNDVFTFYNEDNLKAIGRLNVHIRTRPGIPGGLYLFYYLSNLVNSCPKVQTMLTFLFTIETMATRIIEFILRKDREVLD